MILQRHLKLPAFLLFSNNFEYAETIWYYKSGLNIKIHVVTLKHGPKEDPVGKNQPSFNQLKERNKRKTEIKKNKKERNEKAGRERDNYSCL